MNKQKQERIYHMYPLIFIFAQAQDLYSAGAGMTEVTHLTPKKNNSQTRIFIINDR